MVSSVNPNMGIGGGFNAPGGAGQGAGGGQSASSPASSQLEQTAFSCEAQAMQACFQANCTCVNNISETTEMFLNDDGCSGCACAGSCSTSTV